MLRSQVSRSDRLRVRFWSIKKVLAELQACVIDGDVEWAKLLLERSSYATIGAILDAKSWEGTGVTSLKTVLILIPGIPKERLPVGADLARITFEFRQAILKVPGRPNSALKRKSN
jgi:hypothetical protein